MLAMLNNDILCCIFSLIKPDPTHLLINKKIHNLSNRYIRMHMESKIEALLKMVVEDDEYDVPQFLFLIYDDVYDGPNLGVYGGIEDSEDEKNFKVEYYEQYDQRFDTSSCIHLFPFHEEFKSKIISLSKSFEIGHRVNVTISDDYLIEYKIFNIGRYWYDGREDEIVMEKRVSKCELMNIMINVFTKYPDLCITDVDSFVYL